MDYYNMYLANAFTDRAFTGNATGVIINSGKLQTDVMQNIAKDLNQDVTVFIKKLDFGLYATRFFTRKREINLCGHATIATFYALAQHEYIQPIEEGTIKVIQYTGFGKVHVDIDYKNYKVERVHMNLIAKEQERHLSIEEIIKALGIKKEDLGLNGAYMEPKKISTGSADIVIPVQSLEILEKIKIDYEYMQEISIREDIISFQVFTIIENKDGVAKVRQRTFSPSICVEEEAGSGTSTGATLYYINRNIDPETNRLESVQGVEIGRKSCLLATLDNGNEVRVGGRAFVFMNGVLNI